MSESPDPKRHGQIYIIQTKHSQWIKIGFTKSWSKRLKQFNTHTGDDWRLVHLVDGSRDDEMALHNALGPWIARGEWYRPTPEVLATIERFKEGARTCSDLMGPA